MGFLYSLNFAFNAIRINSFACVHLHRFALQFLKMNGMRVFGKQYMQMYAYKWIDLQCVQYRIDGM